MTFPHNVRVICALRAYACCACASVPRQAEARTARGTVEHASAIVVGYVYALSDKTVTRIRFRDLSYFSKVSLILYIY